MIKELVSQIRDSVVAIGFGQVSEPFGIQSLIHLGTGFCIRDNNIFLTCQHVLLQTKQSGEGLYIMFNKNNLGQCIIPRVLCWKPVENS